MSDISLFENFKTVIGQMPIEEMLDQIMTGVYKKPIDFLRKMVDAGEMDKYNNAKKKLKAFTVMGLFDGGRRMDYLIGYTRLLILDIDKLSPEEVKRIKGVIIACENTFACFKSPSGRGLKILVRVSTGIEEHRNTFKSLQRFYSVLTGVEIDPSGKDITRLCFVSDDDKLYHNPASRIYVPLSLKDDEGMPAGGVPIVSSQITANPPPETSPLSPPVEDPVVVRDQPLSPETIAINAKYRLGVEFAKSLGAFTEGNRNSFVFALAVQLRKSGLAQMTAESLIMRDYNYHEQEVRNTIQSVYSYNWPGYSAPSVQPPMAGVTEVVPGSAVLNPAVALENQPEKRSRKREKYKLRTVEKLLKSWYETRYNVVTGLIEWRHACTNEMFIRLEDKHENSMFRNLHYADELVPIGTLHIILNSDFSPDFNPFTSYFKGLAPWDGVTDYIGQLAATVKTTDDVYWEFCLRKWFVAYATSLFDDQVINHTVIVLTGAQGIGKTSWMKSLVPSALKEYMGSAILQSDSKDASIQLAECALILLDELENLNRRDLAAFKEMITRPDFRIRRPYGRNFENLPRRASFAASVNFEQILTDLSGSRRYLCSKDLSIEYQHKVDIDRAMAQAYALSLSGFKYWFDQEEIRELTIHNNDFLAKSIEEELIETWLQPVTRYEWDHKNQFLSGGTIQLMTATQIATKLLEKTRITLVDNTIVKIGKIMVKLGYERIRNGNSYKYMVRMLDQETFDRINDSLDPLPVIPKPDDGGKTGKDGVDLSLLNEGEDELPF